MLDEAPFAFVDVSQTPVGRHLFEIGHNCFNLDDIQAVVIRNKVAKVVFVSKCARPHVLLAVAFPITRVRALDEDD